MKFIELKKYLKENTGNIFLIDGDDVFFRKRAVEMLKERFVTEPSLNFTILDGDDVLSNPDKLISSVEAYPFMSEKRIVLVSDFYPKADVFNKYFSTLFENPPFESILVIDNSKNSEVLKKTEKTVLINCDKADIDLLVRWITNEFSRNNIEIVSMDAEKIAEYCLRDMTKIQAETQKLISYARDKSVITEADINQLVSKETEYQIYEMTDYIGKKRYDLALATVKDMLAKGEAPQRLIISIYNYFRRLLHVSLSNQTNAELAKILGIKEYAVKKTREQASSFNKKALKSAVDFLSNSDYLSKSGKTTFEDALSLSLFKILT